MDLRDEVQLTINSEMPSIPSDEVEELTSQILQVIGVAQTFGTMRMFTSVEFANKTLNRLLAEGTREAGGD